MVRVYCVDRFFTSADKGNSYDLHKKKWCTVPRFVYGIYPPAAARAGRKLMRRQDNTAYIYGFNVEH